MAWEALGSTDLSKVFERAASLDAVATAIRATESVDVAVDDVDARVTSAVIAMIATARRVFGAVAHAAATLGDDERRHFDAEVIRLVHQLTRCRRASDATGTCTRK